MKLITLSCPKCSAQLQINEELTHAICNYCGYHFLVDDEAKKVDVRIQNPREIGRELEYGRRSAVGGNKELADEVGIMMEPLARLGELTMRYNRLYKAVEGNKKSIERDKTTFGKLLPFIWFAGIFILFFMSGMSGDSGVGESIGVGLFCGLVALGITFLVQAGHKSSLKKNATALNNVAKEIERHKETLKGHNVDIIPPDYRYRQAMQFFYTALRNQRAMTMQEAVNLYEEYLHQNRMEAMQAEQIQKLNKLNKTAKTNTYINMANYMKE
ncbi:MAG: hypothetical protein IJV16_06785 [Lachnospiraceae bacterium]|nr:hypothetical protein [Lachnospiraceae bacterium]